MNEPASFKSQGILSAARQLYYDSYGNLRWPDPHQPQVTEGLLLLIHDAFMGLAYWTGFMTNRDTYQGVSIDTHSYSIFSSPELALNWGQHINVSYSTVRIPSVVTASFIGGVHDRKGYLRFYSVQSLGHRWRVDRRHYRLRQVSAIFEVHFFFSIY